VSIATVRPSRCSASITAGVSGRISSRTANAPTGVAVEFDDDDGAAVGLESVGVGGERAWLNEARFSDPHRVTADCAGDSVSGDGVGVAGFGAGRRCSGEDGGGERVVAVRFQRGGEAEDFVARASFGNGDVDDGGLVAGQGSGLVERDDADAGDRERARRRCDQHDKSTIDPQRWFAEQRTNHPDRGGDDQDAGHERSGDAVGEAL